MKLPTLFPSSSRLLALTALALLLPAAFSQAQSLEVAIEAAMRSNPDLNARFHEFRVAEYKVREAKSARLPSVNAGVQAGAGTLDSPETRSGAEEENIEPWGLNLVLEQKLFNGFATSNAIDRSKFELQSKFYSLQSQAQDTVLKVVDAYLEVLQVFAIEDLAKENVDSHQAIYDQIKLRSESGVGSMSDLTQVSGRLAKAHANLIAASNNSLDALSAYNRVVGEQASNLKQPDSSSLALPPSKFDFLELAKQNHPLIKAAFADIYAAKAALNESKSAYLPKVSLELSQNYRDDLNQIDYERDELRADIKLSYNLYRGGADKALQKQRVYTLEQVKDAKDSVVREIVQSAEIAWNTKDLTEKQIKYLKHHVEQSYLTRQAYREQFNLGRRTLLDLLDIENELFEARRNYAIAETKYTVAKYRLKNISGTLLSDLKVDTKAYWQE